MSLTLHSSTSFINKKETKNSRNRDDISNITCFAQIKPSFHLKAKNSKEVQLFAPNMEGRNINNEEEREKLHVLTTSTHSNNSSTTKVPVFVMLPLDTINIGGNLNKPRAMNASLMALKSAGVEGVMVDCWWGLVEKDGPLKYNWEGYYELVKMVQEHGLKLQVVMSFHQCGGNVGDSCSIPLPPWVLEEISKNPDLVYTDRSGRRNPEYITLGCDLLPVLRGRTPIQVYTEYMRSFRERFKDYLGDVIVEIQVGMGPCGELRYPSYPESNGTWRFPGIGEFQCYDKYLCSIPTKEILLNHFEPDMLAWPPARNLHRVKQKANLFPLMKQYMKASLAASAEAMGKNDWGRGGPHDSGQYNQFPEDTGFFKRDGTWNNEYGQFFLEWYSGKLLEHGDRILGSAEGVFRGTGAKLSGKVAGTHWHYNTRSHAAELTAGYYNTRHRDGYLPIARMFAKHGVVFNFTCMEMRDGEQPQSANCSPEGLVRQVKKATQIAGIELAGENALERYDGGGYAQVLATSRSESGNGLSAFTYLRLNKRLFEPENWRNLVEFVKCMSEGGKTRLPECDTSRTGLYVGFVKQSHAKKTAEAVVV